MRFFILCGIMYLVGSNYLNTFAGGWLSFLMTCIIEALLNYGDKKDE